MSRSGSDRERPTASMDREVREALIARPHEALCPARNVGECRSIELVRLAVDRDRAVSGEDNEEHVHLVVDVRVDGGGRTEVHEVGVEVLALGQGPCHTVALDRHRAKPDHRLSRCRNVHPPRIPPRIGLG